jgi:hypothetical protein
MSTGCKIEGCGKGHWALGLCQAHYTRQRRGDNDLAATPTRTRAAEIPIIELVRLYSEEKQSTGQIGRLFGVGEWVIAGLLKRQGVNLRGPNGIRHSARKARSKLDETTIVRTYVAIDDIGVYELARLHNASPSTVKSILIEHNIPIRSIFDVRHAGKWKRGEANPFWDPDRTDEERKKSRSTIDVSNWRMAVWKRDNFECQSCGTLTGRLEAHHIESWSTSPDKRFDVKNGITFCQGCHIEFHRRFGKKNNDRVQLAAFLAPAMEIAA